MVIYTCSCEVFGEFYLDKYQEKSALQFVSKYPYFLIIKIILIIKISLFLQQLVNSETPRYHTSNIYRSITLNTRNHKLKPFYTEIYKTQAILY